MNELYINGTAYNFNFGFGFIRKIGGAYKVPVAGIPGASKDAGLLFALANVYDGDLLTLVHVLDVANEGQTPRLKKADLEAYIEDENTDVEGLIQTVLGFFERANCCKRTMQQVRELAEAQEKKKEA